MRDLRPSVDPQAVTEIVESCSGRTPQAISQVSSGLISATYECVVPGSTLIAQFTPPNMSVGLAVERAFRDRLALAGVPLREVVGDGEHEGLKWTVTRKASGRSMASLGPAEYRAALPSAFDTLAAIASVDVSDSIGFGWFGFTGNGSHDTWGEHLGFVADEEPGMFFGNWHDLFDTTFLEADRFKHYLSRMMDMLRGLSTPRQLVHGGFGYDNVLIENGRVSAVLDWQDARFGDSLFDLAYMDFWPSGLDLAAMFEGHCSDRGIHFEDYQDRVTCYKYYIGLDSMRFFAKTDNRAAYDGAVDIVEALGR